MEKPNDSQEQRVEGTTKVELHFNLRDNGVSVIVNSTPYELQADNRQPVPTLHAENPPEIRLPTLPHEPGSGGEERDGFDAKVKAAAEGFLVAINNPSMKAKTSVMTGYAGGHSPPLTTPQVIPMGSFSGAFGKSGARNV